MLISSEIAPYLSEIAELHCVGANDFFTFTPIQGTYAAVDHDEVWVLFKELVPGLESSVAFTGLKPDNVTRRIRSEPGVTHPAVVENVTFLNSLQQLLHTLVPFKSRKVETAWQHLL